jgi:hypothetical protein
MRTKMRMTTTDHAVIAASLGTGSSISDDSLQSFQQIDTRILALARSRRKPRGVISHFAHEPSPARKTEFTRGSLRSIARLPATWS